MVEDFKYGTERVIDTDYREAMKLRFDFFKHLTTLSTGSLLLLVAFLEKLFQNPQWPSLIIWVISLLISSTLGSLVAMLVASVVIEESGKHSSALGKLGEVIAYAVIGLFVLSLILLTVFAGKNFG